MKMVFIKILTGEPVVSYVWTQLGLGAFRRTFPIAFTFLSEIDGVVEPDPVANWNNSMKLVLPDYAKDAQKVLKNSIFNFII
jgi:hypothetical protein